jgi:hypothetical protein
MDDEFSSHRKTKETLYVFPASFQATEVFVFLLNFAEKILQLGEISIGFFSKLEVTLFFVVLLSYQWCFLVKKKRVALLWVMVPVKVFFVKINTDYNHIERQIG